jgi:outer membrane protein assembly factor BamE (lipoprotein component of BamABCDE complex)
MTYKTSSIFLTGAMLLIATAVMAGGGADGGDSGGAGIFMQEDTQLTLRKGVTTQAQVLEVLGDPSMVTTDPAGGIVWTYQIDATVSVLEDGTSFLITLCEGASQKSLTITLTLAFDASRRVIEFKTSPPPNRLGEPSNR